MAPDLTQAAIALAAAGAGRVVVVPLFLGTGGHLRQDLPVLLAQAQGAVRVPLTAVGALGEDEAAIAAMAEYCLRAASRAA
jgi:sirohydrochlorin cobaltochelatase